ncbi:MAG: DUF2189 domain-containing protein [Pseudomonadota bacterium]
MNSTKTANRDAIAGVYPLTLSFGDIRDAMRLGVKDFISNPILSGFFGLFYTLGGLFIYFSLIHFDETWMILPIAIGFPLVGPFVAAGLYEISRRRQKGRTFTWSEILTVVFGQSRREMGWMAFVVLFIFWMWIYQVRMLLAVFLGNESFSTLEGFFNASLTTQAGFYFLAVGSVVGAILAAILFSVTVISMPLLLDRDIDFISAMIVSVKTVNRNPVVLLSWGAVVSGIAIVAMLPAFLGLLVALPVLGHATWHVYQRAIGHIDG